MNESSHWCPDCGESTERGCACGPEIDRLKMAEYGYELLRRALRAFKEARATKTVERVRFAISSAKGAVRHARLAPYREERRRKRGDV